jgi:hypothetical protein
MATIPFTDNYSDLSSNRGFQFKFFCQKCGNGYMSTFQTNTLGAAAFAAQAVSGLLGGKAGEGRITETAGVRGIDESDLKSAAFDQAQLDGMVGNRVDDAAAAAYASEQGWSATSVPYAGEAKRGKSGGTSAAKSAGGMLGALGGQFGSLFGSAAKVAPKSEDELAAEELALGPAIAGRVLGARPLWNNPGAQQRVNRVGRWVASQTSRPVLP